MRILDRWSTILSAALTVLTVLLLVGLTSALPPVLDIRAALLLTSALGSIVLFGRPRSAARRARRALTLGRAASLALIAAATLYDLTLAYRTEEVSFSNGDVTLHGTLYLPRRAGRHPAVVLVHGSGNSPRDESRFYARAFARRGIAALAYDKRGSGESSGDLAAATYQELGGDAAQAVELLRHHPQVDAERIGVRGISEGEWTGVVAARQARAAFVVIVSGSAMTPAEQVAYETAERVRRGGYGDDAARRAGDLYRRLSAFQRTGAGRDQLNGELQAASKEPWFATAWYLEESVPEYDRVQQLRWFPAWRARMDFDALALMAELRCPVLLQEGGADQKMDGAGAIERMRAALARGGNARFTGLLYPNATHNIIEWRLPRHLPPPWFARGYLGDQLDWVAKQVGLEG
jgi:pimeloyl-ACP methyl ester carboxylesterase